MVAVIFCARPQYSGSSFNWPFGGAPVMKRSYTFCDRFEVHVYPRERFVERRRESASNKTEGEEKPGADIVPGVCRLAWAGECWSRPLNNGRVNFSGKSYVVSLRQSSKPMCATIFTQRILSHVSNHDWCAWGWMSATVGHIQILDGRNDEHSGVIHHNTINKNDSLYEWNLSN